MLEADAAVHMVEQRIGGNPRVRVTDAARRRRRWLASGRLEQPLLHPGAKAVDRAEQAGFNCVLEFFAIADSQAVSEQLDPLGSKSG